MATERQLDQCYSVLRSKILPNRTKSDPLPPEPQNGVQWPPMLYNLRFRGYCYNPDIIDKRPTSIAINPPLRVLAPIVAYLTLLGSYAEDDNVLDFVIANHFLEHSEDPILTIKNMLRIVRPDGIIYLSTGYAENIRP